MFKLLSTDVFGWFDLEDAVRKLGYDGGFKIFYEVPRQDLENRLIWVQDDSDIKLLVNNYRKGEAHAYLEHLVDERVGLIENIDAEKATFEAVPNVEETDQIACDTGPSGKQNMDATEDAEKANSKAVDQPAEEEVNGSDGE